ncbi:hypothetical protein ONE63_011512 [Megalurothrips usitatus]|uniref:JmjC domain-containing protein n=1 Tax=Megalurothrips usitatus TaxID=439358 RepID=A0AAV7X2M8_9NEOP|nr:hypothetical protein ONE63_011512 [Megalurothrips usitatus]
MLPDDTCFTKDEYGFPTVIVRAENLKDFPQLVTFINEKGYGRPSGLLKLRLHPDDRRDEKVIEEAMTLLKERFSHQVSKSRTKRFTYNPDGQLFMKASVEDHIYQYVKCRCSASERSKFIKEATELSSYSGKVPNCCTEILESEGLNGLRQHLFSELDRLSTYTDSVNQNIKKLEQIRRMTYAEPKMQGQPLIYGAGIQVDPDSPIEICGGFSLSTLNTVLDTLDEKYDGIAYPYLYVGSKHTVFPWHIEDGGAYSINYLVCGCPKSWYAFAPEHYGLVDAISSRFRLQLGHSSCRALLGDHKVLVADPEVYSALGIPYVMAIQQPGDFMITFPFSLHSGANLGHNLAIAVNFADMEWIELAMYAPTCECSRVQIHMDLTKLIQMYKPDLLNTYLEDSALVPPPGHPCNVTPLVKSSSHDGVNIALCGSRSNRIIPNKENQSIVRTTSSKRGRTLYCPGCSQSFVDNRMQRLKNHIQMKHQETAESLLSIVDSKYPTKTLKTDLMFQCKVCDKVLRGSSTHIRSHHTKEHGKLPFTGAVKV